MMCSTAQDLSTLMTILEENTNFTIYETAPEPSEDGSEQDDIRGSIISVIDRLDDEFIRSLQNMDPHVTEYVDRLKDEPLLYNLIVRAQAYLQLKNQTENVCRAMMRRLEHLYYKASNMHVSVINLIFICQYVFSQIKLYRLLNVRQPRHCQSIFWPVYLMLTRSQLN
jgi:hypothetical protein